MQEGGNRGQSLSWERIELCNDGKCQLRGGGAVKKELGHRSLNERLISFS